MAKVAKKAALLGFDCMIPKRLEALIAEGALPNFEKFINEGSYMTEGFNMPTVTPPSWATICTGAFPRTHGVEDYYYYVEGRSLEHHKTVQAFGSEPLTAETIWDRWDRAGKKCIVVNYPMSWPSHMKNGVMVQGQGLSPAESRWNEEGNGHKEWLASESVISSDFYPMGEQVRFDDAKGWKNLPEDADEPLAFEVNMHFKESMDPLEDQTWYGLTWESDDDGYDMFALCPEKDLEKAFFVIKAGEWSDVAKHEFVVKSDGRTEPGTFRGKLMKLTDDAEDFTLYLSGISGRHGFIAPADGVKNVEWDKHLICNDMGYVAFVHGIIDMDTVVEVAQFHSEWVTEVATKAIQTNPDFDLFYLHTHLIDWLYHGWLSEMESEDPAIREKALGMERAIYQIEDRFLGKMMELFDDNETIVSCVSDHGATRLGPILNTADALKAKGLTHYEPKKNENYWEIYEESEGFNYELDVTKSKAVPQRYMFVYVNLASKYPGGIVADEDYEKVRDEIIDALYDYKHPETGERPILLAVRKEDAAVFGMGGAQAGDVVYALKPEYMAEHGYGLPTGSCGIGELKNCMFFRGPGVKAGFRYERPRWLADIVPTFCYATGGPVPADTEGAPIYQIFENPDLVD
ncbi:alkaline phosphatase family protein [Desulfobaculum bizertense]|uniref:Type I phosphodiesterase / nucleotide pyrophosphatase n=1 Tax=Desulfobaculum bizertense DSM 18034 TaxID=1121442 RepID=A0A1T4VQZ2_9BACT|nr:alkaline phosphatase family protein [Desulfobaculum bizertense]UIJ38306.1 alkaline phosphatase family protein [Desulfobaculum bizertense]SKA67339.1 Type I phosphodiesterase / nucleotide pyrophosphatase [Desulfobaculum bizertense DSM 18034]